MFRTQFRPNNKVGSTSIHLSINPPPKQPHAACWLQLAREEAARQEAVESGMAPVASGSKARRTAMSKSRDRGLQELGGSYKSGMLKVSRGKGGPTASNAKGLFAAKGKRGGGGRVAKVVSRMLK